MRRIAYVQIILGLLLITIGVKSPTGDLHSKKIIYRNIIIALITLVIPCIVSRKDCYSDKLDIYAATGYLSFAVFYIVWQIYSVTVLLYISYTIIAIVIIIVIIQILSNIYHTYKKKDPKEG